MELSELEKHEEITSATFDHDNAHLAVTHSYQGGAASGWNQSLLLKSDQENEELIKALEQVQVKMSMEDFLGKFFGVYWDDAAFLTKLMGMETEDEYRERLQEEEGEEYETYSVYSKRRMEEKLDKIEILKAIKDSEKISVEKSIEILNIQSEFESDVEKAGGFDAIKEYKEGLEKAASNSEKNLPLQKEKGESEEMSSAIGSDKDEISKTEGENISMTVEKTDQTIEKSEAELQLDKALVRMEAIEKAAQEKDEALEKATAKLAELEKAENGRIEKAYKGFSDSLSFVEEGDKEELVKSLMESRSMDSTAVFVKALEKAQAAIDAFSVEKGFDGEPSVEIDKSKGELDKRIEEQYAGKQWL